MPEPGAAYVQVDGAADLEGSFRHAPQENNGRSALLDDPESAVPRRLPDVAYIGVGAVGPWAPVPPAASANAVPDLAARSTAAPPMAGLQPRTNGIVVVFSPGLQRCGFHFDVPSAAVTGAAAVARFHVETDAAGRVMHLLSEPSENPAGARLIESAINTGRAACAGLGDVQVSWGR